MKTSNFNQYDDTTILYTPLMSTSQQLYELYVGMKKATETMQMPTNNPTQHTTAEVQNDLERPEIVDQSPEVL